MSHGMDVRPIVQMPDGRIVWQDKFNMGVIVGLVSCDRMGRLKIVGMHGGNNSRLACHFCAMSGVHIGGSIRQLGYVENTPAKEGKCKGQVLIMGEDDVNRELDHDQQAERAEGVDAYIAG